MKRLIAAVIFGGGMIGGAAAADLYSMKDGAAPVSMVTAPSWTGAIVGVGLEGAFVNHDVALNYGGSTLAELNGLSGIGAGADFLAGVRYQLPNSRFVVGIEGEYSINDSPVQLSLPTAGIGTSLDLTGKWDIMGTAGFLVNPWTLAYVGGGYGQSYYHATGILNQIISDKTIDGAVFKAGLAAKIPYISSNFEIRGEYLFFDANGADLYSSPSNRGGISIRDNANINVARLLAAYQIGGSVTPLDSLK